MAEDLSQPPFRHPLVVAQRLTRLWVDWFVALNDRLNAVVHQLKPIALTAQAVSISATAVPLGTLDAGLYWVTVYARITQADPTSSSLTVTIGFTTGGVACSFSGDALTGNTTNTVQSFSRLIRIDQGTTITYATTYSGRGMRYSLDVLVNATKGSGT